MDSRRKARLRPLIILCRALAAGAPLTAAVPAQAQFVAYFDELMPPRAVVMRLSDRGFTGIDRPRFDGRAYVVDATNRFGERIRFFIDARDGSILGRQRLAPPPMRVARTAPGYGWTEDDIEARGPLREAGRLVPPADIPSVAPSARTSRVEPLDRNPSGLNPDARVCPDAPKKVVRLNPPASKAATTSPRTTPEVPKPADTAAAPNAAQVPTIAAVEPPKAPPSTPAMVGPKTVEPKPVEATAGGKTDTKTSANQSSSAWQDPSPENKRPVRVIGGATVVPGTAEKEQGGAE